MYENILKGIALGTFYGAQTALLGYLKDEDLPASWKVILSKKFWTCFSWTKALKTVLLGAVMGAISQGYGFIQPYQLAWFTEYTGIPQVSLPVIMNFANTAVVMGADQFSKFVVRRTPLGKAWDALKAKVFVLLSSQEKVIAIIEAANAKADAEAKPAEPEQNPT
jgi:hypothetical protein